MKFARGIGYGNAVDCCPQANSLIESGLREKSRIGIKKRARVQEIAILDCFRKTDAMPTCQAVIWANFTNADSGPLSERPTMSPRSITKVVARSARVTMARQMADSTEHKLPVWLLAGFSWIVSAYSLIGFFHAEGFSAAPMLPAGTAALGVCGLFFLFFPFFKKIKIGKILELEREVEKGKEELREFKAEVRNSVSLLSRNVNSISGMTNRINFYNNVPSVPYYRWSRKHGS
jgi:hypothetical protein